jgi:biopolymer transport protein ExbB
MFIFGNPANFVDNDPTKEALQGNYMGIIYKGGFIVPILLAVNFIIIIFGNFKMLNKSKSSSILNLSFINDSNNWTFGPLFVK